MRSILILIALTSFLGAKAQDNVMSLARNNKDKVFKIALVLPFNSLEPRSKLTEVMLDYYAGFKIGIEQVSLEGLKCKLYVYDNTKDSTGLSPILKDKKLPAMDLIVGPVYDQDLERMSHFCDSTNQTLVAPLRYFENSSNTNPIINFFPSDEIQVQSIVDVLYSKYPNHLFCIARDLTDESEKMARVIQGCFKYKNIRVSKSQLMLNNGNLSGDVIAGDSMIIISASKSHEISAVLEKYLKGTKSSFGIAHFDANKKTKQFKKLDHMLFPDLYYYNKADSTTKRFYRTFKESQMGAPSKYAGIGYDQSVYLAYSLLAYGNDFVNYLPGATYQGIRNRIFLQADKNGNITNYGVYFYKHMSGYSQLVE